MNKHILYIILLIFLLGIIFIIYMNNGDVGENSIQQKMIESNSGIYIEDTVHIKVNHNISELKEGK